MGLDFVAVDPISEEQVDDSHFEGLGNFSEAIIRGNLYKEYLFSIYDHSPYDGYRDKALDEVIEIMERKLQKRRKKDLYYLDYTGGEFTEEEVEQVADGLLKWFKVCRDNGFIVDAYY